MIKRVAVLFIFIVGISPAWAQPFDSELARDARESVAQDKQAPIEYRLSFPAPQHRWMQVEVRFPNVPNGTLQLRMARTSPGRYALHEFAKNVFDVTIVNGKGQPIAPTRPDPHQWDIAAHDGTVVVTYKVFGDRTDGTYLGIDDMHAHINIPAALMFARGWFERPARVTFVRPPGKDWKVATQLFPTNDPLVYTAPNIHYLMDSPTDFSNFMLRTFTVDDGQKRAGPPPTFRVALTHDGTQAEADAFAKDVERIVRESIPVFGELPAFDTNTYTFLSVYLPWANGDGMEHRNSTSLTSSGALRNPQQRAGLIGTVAHEFFHAWNMERLRSAGVEPFDFEEADMSDDLWLGEGFTNYFDGLIQHRAGFTTLEGFAGELAGVINTVQLSPGRIFRSAVDMSRLAPFVDAAASIDRTAWPNLFISYYTYGQAIGLGLDLSLRDRSNGKTSGDDYMRALWARFGRPGQKEPGKVTTPYSIDGLKETLATVSGDRNFANNFFAQFVEGRQIVDYTRLLERAGLIVRKRAAGRPFVGQVQLTPGGSSLRVGSLVPWESPLYKAGVAQDDQLVNLDGTDLTSMLAFDQIMARHKAGDRVSLRFVRRSGEAVNATLELEEDPRVEIVPVEKIGGVLNDDQKRFRESWLNSLQKR
ncbi:MAG: PDZ domain-containing protein [Cyanobacteria bacterium]|nr:PDZ domain-containing protein [Cyanobacteriota bacterium]